MYLHHQNLSAVLYNKIEILHDSKCPVMTDYVTHYFSDTEFTAWQGWLLGVEDKLQSCQQPEDGTDSIEDCCVLKT